MPDEQTTTTTTTTANTNAETSAPPSPRARALAAMDRVGWEGEGTPATSDGSRPGAAAPATSPTPATQPKDPLEELAAKIEAKLKGKAAHATPPPGQRAPSAAPGTGWKPDAIALETSPIAYLESLGFDPVALADRLFEHASLTEAQRKAKADAAELERLRSFETDLKRREEHAALEQQNAAAEKDYLAHLESAKDSYPRLMALDPTDRVRYSYEVAQMIVDAGEDATSQRLAELTERYVARLATRLGAGAQVPKQTAVAGDRTTGGAEGSPPQTITNQLAAESGSPATVDLSRNGRRAAAMRVAAAQGW